VAANAFVTAWRIEAPIETVVDAVPLEPSVAMGAAEAAAAG
jgi:hypothetical protein